MAGDAFALAHTLPFPAQAAAHVRAIPSLDVRRIPWYVWNFALAVTCATVGGTWDISWHISIGRDTFWSPPHIAIYLCGVLAGLGAGYLILDTTLRPRAPLREAAVGLWGFRGPLGAFLCAWGGVAMLASAPFDDWWHGAYGLDVKILSPPHVVLILGILAIKLGSLLLVLGVMNRSGEALRRKLELVFLFVGALLVRDLIGVFVEFTSRVHMHSARFYLVVSVVAPLGLVAIARASRRPWASTLMAVFLMALSLAFLWILPLFPAEPKLGPVYQAVRHFIPVGGFPMLIIVPALALDLLWRRGTTWNEWQRALAGGALFLATLLAVQWPFADFLLSPAARNWFFGSHYLPYFAPPESDTARSVFSQIETTSAEFWTRMALALVAAVLSTRLGLAWGDWMRRIRR